MDKENKYSTLAKAMDRLSPRSVNAFRQSERKYPAVFVNMNPSSYKREHRWYDKAIIKGFARTREALINKGREP